MGTKDDYFPLCKPLIDVIIRGEKTAIVPYVVILETIHTLRSKLTQELNFDGDSRDHCDSKKPIVEGIIKDFVRAIREFSKDGKIIIPRLRTPLSEHHATILKKIRNYFGYVRVMGFCPYCEDGHVDRDSKNSCPSCGCNRDSIRKYNYKGLGHVDIEHAYLAKNTNTNTFYSTDTSFRNLQGDTEFNPIEFKIIPHPDKIKSK